ncbi:MAG TPA: RNA 2',3'-cyclic phosphodiesterase [Dissulfurispiraceae bacterium]|nr:RNA 2',3'-cyclic phosphodiesterase [Dissulfurispiraceae bacterium]
MRCFIAIEPSVSVQAAVRNCVEQLAPLSRDVRWVSPEGLHLTLKFLGEVSDARIPGISALLHSICSNLSPFSIAAAGAGAFPKLHHPHIFWIGIRKSEALERLWGAVEDGLVPLNFPRDSRCFAPHLTIGRVKGMHGIPETASRIHTLENGFFGTIDVQEIRLMQSILRPSGAEYRVVGSYTLGSSTS